MPDSYIKLDSASGKRLLLIVEDEYVNRELLGMTLESDYRLIYAKDGAEAKHAIRSHFDALSLVLLDLNLPDIYGLDILRWMKADPQLSRIPVIVLTSDREGEVESLNAGAMDFIPKPYPMPKVILARVLRTIEFCEDRDILRSTERDHLTGLYNEEFFFRYAEQFDAHHRDTDTDAIVIDVNHFHMINERYGKAYGDEILKRIASRIHAIINAAGGFVCRHEADTFYVYCPHRTDYSDLLDEASRELQDIAHRRSQVRLRMGVYSVVDKSIDIERRFDRAKLAANTVRSNYTKGIAIYDSALHESELFEEHLLESFHDAIAEKQFVVYYQPKYDIRHTDPVLNSSEALVRWNHPDMGMVSPGVFVPLFEKNGLVRELDNYVWQEVAAQLEDWKKRLGVFVPVSVNVSRVDIYDDDLVQHMLELVSRHGLSTSDLLLEITESAYTEDSEQLIEVVRELRAAGFKVEMDDFGSGYSSLNMVSTLPIDALKLDMQFIRNAFNGRRDTRMLEVVLEIADSLMVPSIAEGVETAEQMFTLKSLGCDIVQGYYFSRPVPPQEYEAFLLDYRETLHKGEADAEACEAPERSHSAFSFEVMHDNATGLYNKNALDLLVNDAERNHIALMLAEPEIADDELLTDATARQVADVLRQYFRTVDFICRLNLRQYAVIMTRVDHSLHRQIEEKAAQINCRLMNIFEDRRFGLRFGVAFADRTNPHGTILEDAEAALDSIRGDENRRCAIY